MDVCAKNGSRTGNRLILLIVLSISSGCSLQSPYISPLPDVPASGTTADRLFGEAWWLSLHDPAIDALMTTTLAENPELGQAIARMDEAKAQVGVNSADRLPAIHAQIIGRRP